MMRSKRGAVRWELVLLMLSGLSALAGCGGKQAEKAITLDPDYQSAQNLWRMQRHETVTLPDGQASLIGLYWITMKSHYIGSGQRSGMRLKLGPPALGLIQQNGNRVSFASERGVPVTLNGQPFSGRTQMFDQSSQTPSVIGFDEGKGLMSLVSTGGRYAIQVRHADAETRVNFKGLDYWPIDPAWKIQAKYTPYPAGKTLEVVNVAGITVEAATPGYVEFQRDGKSYRLDVIDEGGPAFVLIFADLTSGHDSYGQGRYIDLPRLDAAGAITIDMNLAYNPPSAFSQFSTCTLAPKDNRLDFAVTAGEKRYGGAVKL